MVKWRRTSRVILTIALALTTLGADALFSQGRPPASNRRIVVLDGREVVEGEVIVRYRSRTGRIERERAELQAYSDASEAIGRRGARRLRSRDLTTRQMLAALRANPDVELAEPNYVIRASATPNDASMSELWGLLNTGQTVDGVAGVPGADIGATAAWDITTGSRANVVAIIDTGIDYLHPDLAANVFSAPRSFSVTLGSVTVTCPAGSHGFNALNNTCVPFDDSGHGTHVAGIIGAVGNNNVGVTGVNWTANLMAIKVLDAAGIGSTSDAIKAIDFVIKAKATLGADANVRILNASWGGSSYSDALKAEIDAANSADMLFVAAAGTDGTNNDAMPHYPASYTSGNVISVAAADNTGVLPSFSNYGATSVDLAAPGSTTLSTLPDNSYGHLSGTSMAAPHVAGAAALVLSVCPSNTATLKSRLLASVDPEASMSGKTVSGGRLNVGAALQQCAPTLNATINGTTITANVGNGPGNPTDWLGLYCPATNGDTSRSDWKYLNGTTTAPATGSTAATVTFQAPSQDGIACNVRLFASNDWIKLATSNTVTVSMAPQLSINDVSVTEGNSGSSMATFTVTLNPAQAAQTVTVAYATANGTATASSDYVTTAGTLTFDPSVTTRTISVPVTGDTTFEPTETFLVNLSTPGNAAIADGQGIGTVANDDVMPTPTVTASVNSNGTIAVTITNGPANPGDWVALYPNGANDQSHVYWSYLNGQRAAPAAGVSSATLQFPAPANAGTYNVRLFANDSWTKLATSGNITVGPPPAPSITVTPSVSKGGTITVTINNGPGNPGDWVALFPSSGNDQSYVQWSYLNGQKSAPAAGLSSATLQFTAPMTDGTYNVRLFANDSWNKIATSPNIAVGFSVTASSSTTVGGTITVTIADGPGNPGDWVALYPIGANDQSHGYWSYLNGQRTSPATGIRSATLQFPAPSSTGTYHVRLFANDSWTKLGTSGNITVGPPPASSLTVTSSVNAGGTITVTVDNGPGNAGDWIALYPTSANDQSHVYWSYLNGQRTAPGTGVTSATLQFPAPMTAGTYDVRLFANDSWTKVATSATITVGGPPASTITVTPSVNAGGTITVTIENGPGAPGDWVALFPSSGDDRSYVNWMYMNGQRVAPASGISSATLQFPAPMTAGTYNVRLFSNDSWTKVATSGNITVSP